MGRINGLLLRSYLIKTRTDSKSWTEYHQVHEGHRIWMLLVFQTQQPAVRSDSLLSSTVYYQSLVFRSSSNMWLNRAFILQYYKLNISFTVTHEPCLRHRWHFVSKANVFQDLTAIANKEFEAYTLEPLETSHIILGGDQWCYQYQFLTEIYFIYVISKELKSAYNPVYSCKSSTSLYTRSWHCLPTLYLISNCLF